MKFLFLLLLLLFLLLILNASLLVFVVSERIETGVVTQTGVLPEIPATDTDTESDTQGSVTAGHPPGKMPLTLHIQSSLTPYLNGHSLQRPPSPMDPKNLSGY